jgi:TIR domain/Patatin-like phospholipase
MRKAVFLSYAHEDIAIVDQLATALEESGFDVWWDKKIKTGSNYVRDITDALRAADHAIVVWSKNSIHSEWVYSEAKLAKDIGNLLPVRIADVEPPPPFNIRQTISLIGQEVARELVRMLLEASQSSSKGSSEAPSAHQQRRILALDGWGGQALVTCGLLEALEETLSLGEADPPSFRLSDHFDLVSGGGFGAVIAAMIGLGFSAQAIRLQMEDALPRLLKSSWSPYAGVFHPQYSIKALARELENVFAGKTLSDSAFKTRLLFPLRPLGSEEIHCFSSHMEPFQRQNAAGLSANVVSDDRPLVAVLSAAVCSPFHFGAQQLVSPAGQSVRYMSLGTSVFNDPSLITMAFATSRSSGLGWPLGKDAIHIISVGSGMLPEALKSGRSKGTLFESIYMLTDNLASAGGLNRLILNGISSASQSSAYGASLEAIAQLVRPQNEVCTYYRLDVQLQPELHTLLSDARSKRQFLQSLRNVATAPKHGIRLLSAVGKESARSYLNRVPLPRS